MIQAYNLCLSFGKQPIFDKVSFTINESDRIGLIGRNGSGKTTLLKAILDQSVLDDGTVTIQSRKKIAYMPQEVVLLSSLSILDETYTTFSELHALEQELEQLELILPTTSDAAVFDRYATLQEQLLAYEPDILKAKTKKILMGLGFSVQQLDQPVSSLSVGWKMRIVLAKLLLQEADFYLFDEPTNHLDLIAKEWFLDFLKQSDFGFMLICHERYFLDELCDKILELERGKATWYNGNYSDYVVRKEHDLKLLHAAYVLQQKEIDRKQANIERFRASASRAKMAQSMQKALDKIERIEIPPALKTVSFGFPPVQQSGKMVIKVDHVSQTFGDKTIFKNVTFEVERGQKVALIAPNGVGKTTLFNLIAGLLPLQHGTITYGHNVTHSIFAQDQNKALNMNQSVIDNIRDLCPKVTEQKIRSFLGAFLFSGEDVLKKVSVLSGGEKNRVGMVGVLLQQANLLLLDEPTNHLDIPSKDILLKALQEFTGTLLFVSHDRDFIKALATDIIELTRDGAHYYHGTYDEYIYHKQIMNPTPEQNTQAHQVKAQGTDQATSSPAALNTGDVHKKIKRLEERIVRLEQQMSAINETFADLEYGTPEFDTALDKQQKVQKELDEAEAEWEKLQHLK